MCRLFILSTRHLLIICAFSALAIFAMSEGVSAAGGVFTVDCACEVSNADGCCFYRKDFNVLTWEWTLHGGHNPNCPEETGCINGSDSGGYDGGESDRNSHSCDCPEPEPTPTPFRDAPGDCWDACEACHDNVYVARFTDDLCCYCEYVDPWGSRRRFNTCNAASCQ